MRLGRILSSQRLSFVTKTAAIVSGLWAATSGCNLIFGIQEGAPSGGQGGSGAAGSGGATGDGGAMTQCLPARPETCASLDDKDNCCSAGRECGGGSCVNGECTPETLASTQAVFGLALSGDRVFWNNGDQVVSVSREGGAQDTVGTVGDAGAPSQPGRFAANDTHVFFTDRDGPQIWSVPIAGGDMKPIAHVPNGKAGFGQIAVTGNKVFWAMQDQPGGVWSAPANGEDVEASAVGDFTSPGATIGVAVDATHVYMTDALTSGLYRAPLSDLADVSSVGSLGGAVPGPIALDADRVYIVFDNQSLGSFPKGGGSLKTLHTGDAIIFGLGSDGQDLYWTTNTFAPSSGFIRRIPASGSSTSFVTLVEVGANNGFSDIALGCDSIYVGQDTSPAEILRISK